MNVRVDVRQEWRGCEIFFGGFRRSDESGRVREDISEDSSIASLSRSSIESECVKGAGSMYERIEVEKGDEC